MMTHAFRHSAYSKVLYGNMTNCFQVNKERTTEPVGTFQSQQAQTHFAFVTLVTASRPALGPTQPPIQWVPVVLSLGVKRPRREARLKKGRRDNFIFYFTFTATSPFKTSVIYFSQTFLRFVSGLRNAEKCHNNKLLDRFTLANFTKKNKQTAYILAENKHENWFYFHGQFRICTCALYTTMNREPQVVFHHC
jgi:hypothetical protein